MQKLSSSTVRLISGTQVITSVHSVVKELVENSLDSGSTNVEVNLENFGLDKLEVRDNGSGIPKEEVAYIAKSHYTSKLKDITDLNTLETFGFRGEALSSLVTVAKVSVMTATKEDDVGMVYNFDAAGNITSKRPVAAGIGSCVTATDLFVNVPVRRQFYKNSKQCRDELKKIEHLMIAFGLVHNSVRFVLRHSRNVIWQKAAMSNLHSNMIAIFGSSVVQQMKWLHCSKELTELSGYFPALGGNSTEITRSSADHMYVFVNKRLVDNKQVNQVIRDAFKMAYPTKRYPIMCLFIRVPQSEVDVNLEPSKYSILLHNLDEILDQLTDLLAQLYNPETEGECLMAQQEQDLTSESDAIPMDKNFSQFSDNAVLSPPTTNNHQQVLPVAHTGSSGDEHLIFTNREFGLTAGSDSTASASSPQSESHQDNDVTVVESPDIENQIFQPQPLKETDADTVIISSEGVSSDNSKERPFKFSTSGCSLNWSKGQCKEGHKMEPVSLLQKDHSSRSSHAVSLAKKPATSFKLSREGCRSIKKSSQKMKLTNFFEKVGVTKPSIVPQVVVKFYKDNVRTYWEEGKNFALHNSSRLSVIGPISQRHQWLVVVNQHIHLFDVKRANQNVLYHRLLASFKLLTSPLPTPVSISEHNVGGLDNMSLLKTLDSESTAANGNRFYSDPRLTANGFHLCHKIVHGQEEIELASLHKSLKMTDLRETLTLIKEQTSQKELCNVLLKDCRPSSVQKILQEEAVRMSQVQLSTLQAADVLELMEQEQVDSQCYHLVHSL